jgi:hypothetical protein
MNARVDAITGSANADRMRDALGRRRGVAARTRARAERLPGLPMHPRRARGARRVRLASDTNAPSPTKSNVARHAYTIGG